MKRSRLTLIGLPLAFVLASGAFAKLPPPSDEAKAKAAEAAAKAAWAASAPRSRPARRRKGPRHTISPR